MSEHSWPTASSWYGLSPDQRDWSDQISRLAVIYSSPVIMTSPIEKNVLENGSGFLLKPGDRSFLVTNAHVLDDGYFKIKKKYGAAALRFGGIEFEPDIISINRNPLIDLAVLNVDGLKFSSSDLNYWGSSAGSLSVYSPSSWPSAQPTDGEATIVVGWPQDLRVRGSEIDEFAALPLGGQFIDGTSKFGFAIPFERKYLVSSDFDPAKPVDVEKFLAGMSGSPVFALHRAGPNPLQLVGVTRWYNEAFDSMFCTRSDLIDSNGNIVAPE